MEAASNSCKPEISATCRKYATTIWTHLDAHMPCDNDGDAAYGILEEMRDVHRHCQTPQCLCLAPAGAGVCQSLRASPGSSRQSPPAEPRSGLDLAVSAGQRRPLIIERVCRHYCPVCESAWPVRGARGCLLAQHGTLPEKALELVRPRAAILFGDWSACEFESRKESDDHTLVVEPAVEGKRG